MIEEIIMESKLEILSQAKLLICVLQKNLLETLSGTAGLIDRSYKIPSQGMNKNTPELQVEYFKI